MKRLGGCDDRAPLLEENHLSALRWGAEQVRFPLSELTPGEVIRSDKGKLLGVFGEKEERVRTDFDRLDLTIWVPRDNRRTTSAAGSPLAGV